MPDNLPNWISYNPGTNGYTTSLFGRNKHDRKLWREWKRSGGKQFMKENNLYPLRTMDTRQITLLPPNQWIRAWKDSVKNYGNSQIDFNSPEYISTLRFYSYDPETGKTELEDSDGNLWGYYFKEGGKLSEKENENENENENEDDPQTTSNYIPVFNDLVNFVLSFETFSPKPYVLNGQTLAGYGSSNPNIIKLAEQEKLTEDAARKEVERVLVKTINYLSEKYPAFNKLEKGIQYALTDIMYRTKGIAGSKLEKMLISGETDGSTLAKEMDYTLSSNSWSGARCKAEQAMAKGDYDWNWPLKDKYGRQIEKNISMSQDWKNSHYWGYHLKQGGVLKRK